MLAPSFADIFRQNADSNGLAAIELAPPAIREIVERAERAAPYELTIDLGRRTVRDAAGFEAAFEMDDFRRTRLMEGLDRIALTLRHAADIEAHEAARWRDP